ncbi:MAG: cysteine peptidase family C39 domain-containing protein [Candidatus Ozemobacteraceae bacterium]
MIHIGLRKMICGSLFSTIIMFSIYIIPATEAIQYPVASPQNEYSNTKSISTIDAIRLIQSKHYFSDIPDVIQMNSYSCGVGCVQAVAMHFGVWGYQDEYARELGATPEDGTHPLRITKYLVKIGLDAKIVENMSLDDLRHHIDTHDVVIINYQAWGDPIGKNYSKEWEDGHYSVAIGYNEKMIFIEDPSLLGTIGYLTNDEFLSRWHDYENENGKRREYRNMGIVVRGKSNPQPRFTHID